MLIYVLLFFIPFTHARAILIFFKLYFHLPLTISKGLRMFEFVGVKVISSPTYYRHVDMYIQPTLILLLFLCAYLDFLSQPLELF